MDISQVELTAAARQSAKDAHDKQSITPRHVNSLVKHIFNLCDAYEQLVTAFEHLQRRLDASQHGHEADADLGAFDRKSFNGR